jgi:hypothetical protein
MIRFALSRTTRPAFLWFGEDYEAGDLVCQAGKQRMFAAIVLGEM